MSYTTKLKWARFILFLAAAYNIVWGIIVSLVPELILFDDVSSPFILIILRCVGMLVGVYGIAYYIASKDPAKYWSLVFVGYVGKILGPIGAFYYVYTGAIKKEFLIVNIFNDLIWLIPFTWIIYQAVKGKLSPPATGITLPLYQRGLGTEFDTLAPAVKAFHSTNKPLSYAGTFSITRGKSFMSNLIANMAGLPAASGAVTMELTVTPSENGETWSRIIGGKKVASKQWMEGEYIAERFRGMELLLKLSVVDGNLVISDVSSTVMGIPMPPFFTPTGLATEKDAGDGVAVNVDIGFKPFGRVINYSGTIKPVEKRSPV